MIYDVPHFIQGEYVIDSDASTLDVFNPAKGQVIGRVPVGSEARCAQTIQNALKAWPAWSETPPIKRARILFKFRELLEKNQDKLAEMVTREHGKTLEDAKGSIARAIELTEWHCGLLAQVQGQFSANVATGIDSYTFSQSLGVCVGVSPFNFPVMVAVWMMIPAIACGNTFILKPSEQTPSASVYLLELLKQAGLPAGVAQCVHGNKDTVHQLITHPDVMAVTAVASTAVAESIYTTATALGKRAHTFGGAKNHCVVMPDANIEQAAQAITGAAYGSAGERCMALSVVVAVGDDTANQLISRLSPLIKAIKVDSGDHPHSDMGPLVSQAHRQRVLAAIDKGVEDGASLIIDGRHFVHPQETQGFFVGPSLFDHVEEHMDIYQKEIFGPVLVILRVQTFNQALDLVNRHQYGNGSAIFTKDGGIARHYAQQVQAGMVGINIPIPVPIASHPFGGWKRSAFGDSNMHGFESIHFYTKRKTVTSRWLDDPQMNNAFIMPTNK